MSRGLKTATAEQPDDDQDDHHQAQNTAETGQAVAPMRIVSAATAKQKDDNNDDYR